MSGSRRKAITNLWPIANCITAVTHDARPLLFPALLILVCLAKLTLVAHHDIVAVDRPHDDYWQILAADKWVWGRPYDAWTLIHLPVYALFISVSGATGLPLRLSTELVYILGCAVLSVSLGRIGVARSLQLSVFALLVFHPYTYYNFDYALAEMFYSCLMVGLVGLLIRILAPSSPGDLNVSTLLFAFVTGAIWYTRKESMLIGGLLALIALAILLRCLLWPAGRRKALGLTSRLVAAPLAAVLAVGLLISTTNGLKYGLWHTNELTATNFVRAFASLQTIRPDKPIRFVSITRDARMRAYAVSPALRELKPVLDGEHEHWTAAATRRYLGLEGEIGAGWFYWALIDSASGAGYFKNAPETQRFFGRIADEISAALEDGRLPRRNVILPYIDPELSLWVPHLPESLLAIAKQFLITQMPHYPEISAETDARVSAAYDRVANRRTYATAGARYMARGWVSSAASPLTTIQIVTVSGQAIRSNFRPVERIDVQPVLDHAGRQGPPAMGFTIDWPAQRASANLRLRVLTEGGKSVESEPISTLPLHRVIRMQTPEHAPAMFLALDQLDVPLVSRREAMQKALMEWYPIALAAFVSASILYLLIVLVRGQSIAPIHMVVLLLLFAIIFSRIVFFAILDASSWSGQQIRYLLPAILLVPVIPAVVFALGHRNQIQGSASPSWNPSG